MHPPSRQKSPRRFCPNRLGAPVGFINPGSLADRLPCKVLAQADNTQLLGRPKYQNDRPERRSNHRPEGSVEEERHLLSDFGPPLQPECSLRSQVTTRCPLQPEGLTEAPLPTLTLRLQPGYAKTLIAALLRLAELEPTRTNRSGTPAQKGSDNGWRKQGKVHKSNHDTRDHTLYTC